MKLRNKKTGEIIETDYELSVSIPNDEKFYGNNTYTEIKGYSSIKDLLEDWEDYEEPDERWYINEENEPQRVGFGDPIEDIENLEEIGLLFKTEEEAERAVDKLKAWKRLKDKGFKFEGIKEDYTRILQEQKPFRTGKRYLQFNKSEDEDWMKENWNDLSLLFSEEEE